MMYIGRDYLRMTGYKVFFSLFERPNPASGEHKFRLNVSVHISTLFGLVVTVYTHPAWKDEPSVVREWNRTMRPRTALSDMPSDELRSRITIAKWSLNTLYGRFSVLRPAIDMNSVYEEIRALRRELRARGES